MPIDQITDTIHYDSTQINENRNRMQSLPIHRYFFKDNSYDFLSRIENNHSFIQRIYYQLIRKGYNMNTNGFNSLSNKERELRENFESNLKDKYGSHTFDYVMDRLNLTDNIISKRKIIAGFKLAQQYSNSRILAEFAPAINNCRVIQEKIESITNISKQYNLDVFLDNTIKMNNVIVEKISNQDSSNLLILLGYVNMCYLKLLNQLSDKMSNDFNLDKHSDIYLPHDLLVKLQNKIIENYHKQELTFNTDVFLTKSQELKLHLNKNEVTNNLKTEIISELVLSVASAISRHALTGDIDLHYHLDLFHPLLHISVDSDLRPIIKSNPYVLNNSVDNILAHMQNIISENKFNQSLKKTIFDDLNKSQFFILPNKINFEIKLKEEYINKLAEEKKDTNLSVKETLSKLSDLVFLSEFNKFKRNILIILDELIDNKISKIEKNLDPSIKKGIIEQTKNIYTADNDAKKIIMVTDLKNKIISSNDFITTNQDIIYFLSKKTFKSQERIITLEKLRTFLHTEQSESLLQRMRKNIDTK